MTTSTLSVQVENIKKKYKNKNRLDHIPMIIITDPFHGNITTSGRNNILDIIILKSNSISPLLRKYFLL